MPYVYAMFIALVLNTGVVGANDLKDVGPPPETKMPSCEMTYDQLIEIDGMLYFMGNMKKQLDLLMKQDDLKKNKMMLEYVKQKPLIDMQLKAWQKQLNYWGHKWDKECKLKKPSTK